MRIGSAEVLSALDIDIAVEKLGQPVRWTLGGPTTGSDRAGDLLARQSAHSAPADGALSVPDQRTVFELIRRLKMQNVAVILISINLANILRVADRMLILRCGRVVGGA